MSGWFFVPLREWSSWAPRLPPIAPRRGGPVQNGSQVVGAGRPEREHERQPSSDELQVAWQILIFYAPDWLTQVKAKNFTGATNLLRVLKDLPYFLGHLI